jgi:hypothetical protein
MASHRVHVHVHIGNRTTGTRKRSTSTRRRRSTRSRSRGRRSTYAGAPAGSGKNFAALKSDLAKRGAKNPGALAAWIGRNKYGKSGFAKLSSRGRRR